MKQFIHNISHNVTMIRKMFDSIKDLVFIMEADGNSFRYVYVNRSAIQVLDMEENMEGKLIEDVVPEELAETLRQNYNNCLSTKEELDFEERLSTVNGQFIGEASLNPILSDDGTCRYILAIVRDVTDRNQKERELQKTKKTMEKHQKRLNSLVENNGDAVFEFDLQGNFININNMVTQITGYEENDIIGKSFAPLIAEESLVAASAHFDRALNGEKEEYQTWLHKRDGQKILLHVKNVPIVVDGQVVGVYGIAKDVTEKNKLERLLYENEQRYKSLFDNHPDAIYSLDLEGNYTSGNPAREKITGYVMDELLGKSFLPFITPEDREKTNLHFKRAIEHKQPVNYEIGFKHKSGQKIDLSVVNIPIVIDNQVVGLYGVAKNITEQKRAREELIETKEELEVFWNYSVDPVYFVNLKGDIQKVNPAFEKTFGYSEAEVMETHDLIVPSDIIDGASEVDEKIRNGQVITSYETKRRTRCGEILDILASYTPVRNEKGKVIGATAFCKNITDFNKAARDLQKSEEKFRLITENAFDVIKTLSPTGIVEYVSPSNEQVLGYNSVDYIGKAFINHIHPDDIPWVEKGFARAAKGEEVPPVEMRVRHQQGHYVWLEATTTPIIENGEIKQLVSISRDITERKKRREELANMAFYDFLTGLPNRRTFDDRLDMAIHQADRSKKKVAVMMLDGRHFKQVNDTYGHDAGDAVIKELAKRIKASIRETDTVARFGGDEMAVVLPELDSPKMAEDVAKRILSSLEEPFTYNHSEIDLGAGIGISFYPDHANRKKKLLKYADEALYEAKELGRSEYKIYSILMDDKTSFG
ncbi:PAS domain S-box protein [Lentibacillus sp. Marseille-P4043]|uniref:PAS domain S-box protein n=1 Tax=Lentibacillus sp. Marseille-P4043 TaxID=2040293 RepID=UPI000D0B9C3A|nr:PAS domain S-box protein [Lentibacillus sp. Marseille-P4043]